MAIKVTRARARKIRSELELIQMDMRSFDNETWRRGPRKRIKRFFVEFWAMVAIVWVVCTLPSARA